jgi:hypothetical protein
MRTIGISAIIFQRVYDFDSVEKLQAALKDFCEQELGAGYSLIIRTETTAGEEMDTDE